MRNDKRLLLVTSAVGLMLGYAAPAVAQEASLRDGATDEAVGLGDIVVTAQRTSSTVQRTPIAITAASAEVLESRQIDGMAGIGSLVPGLNVQPVTSSNNAARITLRGVSQENGGILYDPGVAIYVDNVYQPRINGAFFDFFDIDRIEVLRGPQGTLYGRNSSGGAIKVVTRTPDLNETEVRGDVAFGSLNLVEARAFASVPLVQDQLALSASIVKRNRDGFMRSSQTGERFNNIDSMAARAKLHYAPNSAFEATLGVDYIQDRGDGGIGTQITAYPGVQNPNISPSRDIYKTELSGPQEGIIDSYGVSANFSYHINDNLTLTAVTGYRWLELSQAAPFAQLAAGYDLGGDYQAENENWSQEVALQFEYGKISGVAGVFYFDESGRQDRGYLGLRGYSTPHVILRDTKAIAGFADVRAEIFEGFSLLAGIRATREEASLTQRYPTIYNVAQSASDTFSDVTPKVGFNWQAMPTLMVYGSYTAGFKSGGFNSLTPNVNAATGERFGPEAFAPETVSSYEAGLKFSSSDRKFRANVAVFQAEYEDLQLPALIPGTAVSTIRNAASARIQGIEFEPAWRPTDELELYATISLTDGEYTAPYTCADVRGVYVDCTNNKIKGVIPAQVNVGFSYEPALNIQGTIQIGGEWQYRDKFYNNVSNQTDLAQAQPLDLLNGFIKWTSPDERWNVTVDGRNLLNEKYYANALILSNATSPSTTVYPGDPRILKVRLGFNF